MIRRVFLFFILLSVSAQSYARGEKREFAKLVKETMQNIDHSFNHEEEDNGSNVEMKFSQITIRVQLPAGFKVPGLVNLLVVPELELTIERISP